MDGSGLLPERLLPYTFASECMSRTAKWAPSVAGKGCSPACAPGAAKLVRQLVCGGWGAAGCQGLVNRNHPQPPQPPQPPQAVELIRKTTNDLIKQCKEMVDEEEMRAASAAAAAGERRLPQRGGGKPCTHFAAVGPLAPVVCSTAICASCPLPLLIALLQQLPWTPHARCTYLLLTCLSSTPPSPVLRPLLPPSLPASLSS